jgi:Flp pilus assembly protein TadD
MSEIDREQARARFAAGEFRECREIAMEALAAAPDDVEWLRLAGRSGVELGSEDAVAQLRRVTELQPDADAWRDLGDALATEGDTEQANRAFRKVLEFNPDDELALTGLGHLAYASGDKDDAVSLLSLAAEHGSRASTAVISLVEMYRSLGKTDEALAAARRLAEAAPDDPTAALDVADLSLAVGKLDDAAEAFTHIREIDDVPGHEVYPLHGLIDVELRRESWEPALALATEATALDPRGRSSEIAAFLQAQMSGAGEEPPPSLADVQAALAASRAEYRLLLADDRNLPMGPAA